MWRYYVFRFLLNCDDCHNNNVNLITLIELIISNIGNIINIIYKLIFNCVNVDLFIIRLRVEQIVDLNCLKLFSFKFVIPIRIVFSWTVHTNSRKSDMHCTNKINGVLFFSQLYAHIICCTFVKYFKEIIIQVALF